jgi:hypothetical protein
MVMGDFLLLPRYSLSKRTVAFFLRPLQEFYAAENISGLLEILPLFNVNSLLTLC